MLNLKSQVNNSEFLYKHLDNGVILEKSNVLEQTVVPDYLMSHHLQIKKNLNLNSKPTININISIVESPLPNKKMTLKDKLPISKPNILNIQSLKKLQVESTLKGKRSYGFWTKQSKEMSKKLWLPTKTGYVGLLGTISTGCSLVSESISSLKIEKNILQNKNSLTTCFPSSMFSLVDTTVTEGTTLLDTMKKTKMKQQQKLENMNNSKYNKKNNTELKPKTVTHISKYIPSSRCYKLSITKEQKKIINDWFASVRKVWNVSLHHLNTHPEEKISDTNLRDKFVIQKQMKPDILKQMKWTLRTPKRIREYATKDLVASYKGCFERLKKKQITHFHIKPKSKNDFKQTICLPHESSYIKNNNLHVCSLDLKIKEKIQDQEIKHNMRLQRRNNTYYVHIVTYKETQGLKPSQNKIVGIDPGINIFHSLYSPSGEYGLVGETLRPKLERIYKKIDYMKKYNPNKKKAIKKRENQIYNMVDDFQWKYCHYLLSNYDKIVIPRLYIRKQNNNIKRISHDMRHCMFVDRLKYKCIEYKGVEIHECKEHNTSRTCTNCLSRKTIKGTTIKCKKCNFEIHRDISGARNMIIKHVINM